MPTAPEYPKRPKFFANHFVRVLAKACVANALGAEGCWLLTVVALTEDAKGYREPVTFFNEQLMPLVGAKNVKALDRIRAKAVAAGWLVYQAGGKGKAGRYWVDIPAAHRGWDDAPTDEPAAIKLTTCDDYSVSNSTTDPGEKRERSGQQSGREPGEKWATFFPIPRQPTPTPRPPHPPAGGEAVGPRPEEVREEWNRQTALTPCLEVGPHRERVIRAWQIGFPLWAEHWRAVIAYMGRTPDYTGGLSSGWRADLAWLLKAENFTKVVERMLAPPAAPAGGKPGKESAEDMVKRLAAERDARRAG